MIYHLQTKIKADQSAVWNALVDAELTQHYMFGCIPVTNWNIGSPIIWQGEVDGIDYVKGHVIAFEPNEYLAYSVFGPNEGYDDVPENYLTSEYRLSTKNDETVIDITQGDFSEVADGEKRYAEAGGGWEVAMQGLKKLLEA